MYTISKCETTSFSLIVKIKKKYLLHNIIHFDYLVEIQKMNYLITDNFLHYGSYI